LKKSPTGPACTLGPLKNKSGVTTNNKGFTFIADNSKIVSFVWVGISKRERKENFSLETRVAPLRTQPNFNRAS
jgi:hypothetical protein